MELPRDVGDVLSVVLVLEERDEAELLERRRGETNLAELVHGRVDVLVPRGQATDARAARRKALGDRVDEDRVLGELGERHDADGLALVHQLPIGLVGDDEEVVLQRKLGQPLDLVVPVPDACRIRGVGEEDRPRPRGDEALDLLRWRKVKAVLDAGGNGHDPVAVHGRVSGVVRVERLGDQDFVAWIARRLKGEAERLTPADGHDHFVVGERDAKLGVVPHHGVDRLGNAHRRAVRQDADFGVAYALHKGCRCRDVRLADVEVVDVDAALLRGVGERGESPNRGPLEGLHAVGNAKHGREPTPPEPQGASPWLGQRSSSRCGGHCPWFAGTRPPARWATRQ